MTASLTQIVSAVLNERGRAWNVSTEHLVPKMDTAHHTLFCRIEIPSGTLKKLCSHLSDIPGLEEHRAAVRDAHTMTVMGV